MRAVQAAAFGGPDVLEVQEIERPRPGPGEVLVKLAFSGVNYMDIYMRSGIYARSDTYKTPLPMTIGMEGAGVVEDLGEGVTEFRAGDRVAYCLSRGSYAEFAVVPAWRIVPVPPSLSLEVATAAMLQGSTAHYLTHSAFKLEAGHVCLVHAGAGGVGQILVQLAKLRAATVIATVGDETKAEIAKRCGADHCILYRQQDFRGKVMEITDGRGVNVAYDSVGKDTIHQSIRSVRRRGLCVLFGASSGPVASIEPIELAEAGSVFFTRPHLSDYMADAGEIRSRAADIFAAVESRKLTFAIHGVMPLEDAVEAHRLMEGRSSRGKLLLSTASKGAQTLDPIGHTQNT
jgi:NADPH:quinone reductase